mmetsp:Transcript_23980/g.52980  ORF Transcript_23980/g.52980 Transcript_23980/m.52980 type:complete len:208 (-) Transcript_23980:1235-1858(-)
MSVQGLNGSVAFRAATTPCIFPSLPNSAKTCNRWRLVASVRPSPSMVLENQSRSATVSATPMKQTITARRTMDRAMSVPIASPHPLRRRPFRLRKKANNQNHRNHHQSPRRPPIPVLVITVILIVPLLPRVLPKVLLRVLQKLLLMEDQEVRHVAVAATVAGSMMTLLVPSSVGTVFTFALGSNEFVVSKAATTPFTFPSLPNSAKK